ncbi:MAG: trigger factor [Vampirovibrionales bacterium]
MPIQSTVDTTSVKNRAVLSVSIPAEFASQEYNKACRRIGQNVNIPGFRRGKAPRAAIEKTVGVDRIKQEALEKLLPPAFADVIAENQLDVVSSPVVETCQFDLDKGVELKAFIELRPTVTLGNVSQLAISLQTFAHPADAMETELANLQQRMTSVEPVIDRPSEANDIVNIDFAGKCDGKPIEGGTAKNYQLDLANNNFIEGFAPQLVGKTIGESFTIQVTFPADYFDKALAGKPAEFAITMNEIKKKVTPELSDEFAKKVGDFDSLEALKSAIQEGLDRAASQENDFRKQKALVDQLIATCPVDVPDTMIERETAVLVQDVKERLKQQGLSWEGFVEAQGKEPIMASLRDDAVKRIKTSLIFGEIAKHESLTIGADEFSAQVTELAQMARVDERTVLRELAANPNATQSINDQLLSRKVMTLMLERAKVTITGTDSGEAALGEASTPTSAEVAVAQAEAITQEPAEVVDAEA